MQRALARCAPSGSLRSAAQNTIRFVRCTTRPSARTIPGNEEEKRAKEMEKAMITFGAGNRTCVGKNISLMEMQKVVPQLLRYFEFRLVDQEREWVTLNRWFNTQKGLEVYVRSRKKVDLVANWQNPGHQKV